MVKLVSQCGIGILIKVYGDFLIAVNDPVFPDYGMREGELFGRLCSGLVFRSVDCGPPGLIELIRYQSAFEVNGPYFMVNKFLELCKVCMTSFFIELFGGFRLFMKVDGRAMRCLSAQVFLFVESGVAV